MCVYVCIYGHAYLSIQPRAWLSEVIHSVPDRLSFNACPPPIHPLESTTTNTITPNKKGMVTSNEPGYYADGRFGIRIESLIICNEASTPNRFGGGRCVYSKYINMDIYIYK